MADDSAPTPRPGADPAPEKLEDVDFAAILAIAEPLLTEALELVKWARGGQLGRTVHVSLFEIRRQWRILEAALVEAGLADFGKRWPPSNDRQRRSAAIALSDLTSEIRGREGGIGWKGNESISMAHDVFARRLAVVVKRLRKIVAQAGPQPGKQHISQSPAVLAIIPGGSGQHGKKAAPTHPTAKVALQIVQAKKGNGLSGKELVAELKKKAYKVEESTLRRSIVPILKDHGVKNSRARGGYYDSKQLEQSD
jgi:hypothetical protein